MLKQMLILVALAMVSTTAFAQDEMMAEAPATPAAKEAVSVSGYVGAVSHYVWRGTRQNSGAASVQGGLDFAVAAVDGLGFGIWIASIGGDVRNETDYYVSYGGEAAGLDYSVGLTMYSYDFSTFTNIPKDGGTNVSTQNEIALGLSKGDFGFNYYMVLAGDSTYGAGEKVNGVDADGIALDWVSLSYGTSLIGMDVSLAYETGTYNQQFVNAGNAVESTAIIAYSLGKSISDNTSVSFNGTKVMTNSDKGTPLANEFWMSMDLSF